MDATFALIVRAPGSAPRRFEFDRDEVVVGRGAGCDLAIEHETVSRRQLVVRRRAAGGSVAFELDTARATNPTLRRGRPATSGPLAPGERLTAGAVEIRIEAPGAPAKRPWRRPAAIAPAAAAALLLLWPDADRADHAPRPPDAIALFPAAPAAACPGAEACAAQAREQAARAGRLLGRADSDPGALYQAAVALDRAAALLAAGGLAESTVPDLAARRARARARAAQALGDARFRLARAGADGDAAGQARELRRIDRLIADPGHPLKAWARARLRDLQGARRAPGRSQR